MRKRDMSFMSVKLVIGFTVMVMGLSFVVPYTTMDTVSCMVTEKLSIAQKDGHKYLIYTENETFENTDNPFMLKFNSSDFYRKIQPGREYKFKVVGFRIAPLSVYRNIIDIVE